MVLRFSPTHPLDDGVAAEMEIDEQGDWVAHEDYEDMAELAFERAEKIRELIRELEDMIDDVRRDVR